MIKDPEMQGEGPEPTREEILAALFANLVVSLCQEAFACLGQMPHPMTGEILQDFERAQFLIGQLEVLLIKTKGNLTPQENEMLKQNIAGLRMAFMEAIDNPQPPVGMPGEVSAAPAQDKVVSKPATPEEASAPQPAARTERPPAPSTSPARATSAVASAAAANDNQEEPKKRYTKKY